MKKRKPTPAEVRRVMAELGRRGGAKTSEAKAAAARENGRRPKRKTGRVQVVAKPPRPAP